MVAAISINGNRVGEGGLFPSAHSPNRRYPVHADIDKSFSRGAENVVEIVVWAIAPSHAGILAGPVGITRKKGADSFTRSQTIGAIFTPLACALALSLLGAMGAAFGFAFRTSATLLMLYCGYCFSQVLFLTTYADLSYEFIPMRFAVPIVFVTARAMDGTLAGLLLLTSKFSGVTRTIARYTAFAVGLIATFSSIPVLLFPLWRSDPIEIARLTQGVIEIVWRLKFVYPCACAALAFFDRRLKLRFLHGTMYLALHAVLYFDSAALFRNPQGDYANRFYAVALAGIFSGYIIQTATEKSTREKIQNQRDAMLGKQARQVAHDIRSPLAALTMINEDLSELSEDKRLLIRSSTERMTDIANLLLLKNQVSHAQPLQKGSSRACSSVLHLLELLITEARTRFRGYPHVKIKTDFSSSTYGYFIKADKTGFRRAFSNILNNAVEALDGSGVVYIDVFQCNDGIQISVRDNGKGIPNALLKSIGERGISHGKTEGHGLGVYQSKEFCRENSGSLHIKSTEGEGTTVAMRLPRASPPPWLVDRLVIRPGQEVVVVDDDATIHHVWDQRLSEHRNQLSITHLYTPSIPREHIVSNSIFLVDFEFIGSDKDGIDVISQHRIHSRSILVTSRGEDPEVLSRCLKHSIPVVLKSSAGFLPIALQKQTRRPEAILIDDDVAIQIAWRGMASIRGIEIEIFSHPDEFISQSTEFQKNTSIYVDFNLSPTLRGDAVTRRLTDMGFSNVYITTADPLVCKEDVPWVKDVVTNSFPVEWSRSEQSKGKPKSD